MPVDSTSDNEDHSDSNSSGPDEDLVEDFTVSGPALALYTRPKSRMQCRTIGAVRGTWRKVANNDLLSDSEDKSPHSRTTTSARKGHLQAGRQVESGRGEMRHSGVALFPVFCR